MNRFESKRDTCATCRFFGGDTCRKHSPMNGMGDKAARWPLVQATDFCGDWEHLSIRNSDSEVWRG